MMLPLLDSSAIVMAANVARAFVKSHRLAYAQILPDLRLGITSPNFKGLIIPPGKPETLAQDCCLPELLPEFVGAEETLRAILSGADSSYTIERVNRDLPDGTTMYLNFEVMPLDEQNPGSGLLLLIEDVTSYGQLEQHILHSRNELSLAQAKLICTNQELERLSQFKSFMLSMAAHDIRSILGAIMLEVDILRLERPTNLTSEQKQSLDSVSSQVKWLGEFMNNLLSLDQVEKGKLRLRLDECDLKEVFFSILANLKLVALNNELVLIPDLPEAPIIIEADIERIKQVVYNLIGNAVKFTPAGGYVQVSLFQEGEQAILRVSDTGQGMSAAQVENLFKPYYRTEEAEKSNVIGSGLGLFISRVLVEAHHGRIEVISQPGQGTTFIVRLPLRQPAND